MLAPVLQGAPRLLPAQLLALPERVVGVLDGERLQRRRLPVRKLPVRELTVRELTVRKLTVRKLTVRKLTVRESPPACPPFRDAR
nr:hypothetical protein GCM10020093_049730 [Planobispora longispora]